MLHNFQFTVDTDESAEKVRDDCAKWLRGHGKVVNADTALAAPSFTVGGVDTDGRKTKPEPFEVTVQAADADAAKAAVETNTKIVNVVKAV
jgi:hypothetical protein